MDIKEVTIFFEERMTSSLHKETTTKKEDRLSQNLSFSHVCSRSNSVWSREFTQTFISTACIEEHMDPCGFIYHTKL